MRINKLIIFFVMVLLLAACTKDRAISENESGVKASFFASVSKTITKAPIESGENLADGGKVGVFALTYSGSDLSAVVWPAASGTYQMYNIEGTVTAGSPKTLSTSSAYYYPGRKKVAFYSYYPKTATLPIFNSGSAPVIEVDIPASPASQSDYLWATPVTGTSLTPNISFAYNHALSLVRLKIQKTYSEVLTLKSVTITTTQKQKAKMSVATGQMTSLNLTGGETNFSLTGLSLNIPLNSPQDVANGKFLFIPGSEISAIKLVVRVSGESFDRDYTIQNPTLSLIKGAAINVILSVSKNNAVVADWYAAENEGTIGKLPTANCYMVSPGGSITIPVNIKGNGDAVSAGFESGLSVTHNPVSMAVVWQTSSGLITLSEINATNKTVNVTTNATPATGGNAVIAAYSGAGGTGTLLWSWHIWVTNYNPDNLSNGAIYSYVNGNNIRNIFMDRNLGALGAAYSNDANILHYQFGRKEPFPASGVFDRLGNSVSVSAIAGPRTMTYAISNPFVFITNSTPTGEYWCSPESDYWWMGTGGTALVKGPKTIFDPCPAGWRVPSWEGGVTPWSGLSTSTGSLLNNGYTHTDWSLESNPGFYPAAGARVASNASITSIGSVGYYWSSLPLSTNKGYGCIFSFNISSITAPSWERLATGLSVRCVKDL